MNIVEWGVVIGVAIMLLTVLTCFNVRQKPAVLPLIIGMSVYLLSLLIAWLFNLPPMHNPH